MGAASRKVKGVRGIVPIYGDGRKSEVTLAEMLEEEYTQMGDGSPIDFATSPEARTIFHRSDRMLKRKIVKNRDDARNDRNRNVWKVLSYLTGFLNHIGVRTEALAAPPDETAGAE